MTVRIMVGDACEMLATLPSKSVQCAVTSPPYFGLRSYLPDGHPDKAMEIGTEQTPDAYIATLVSVFREMRRVLADDGVFWLNIGDSYSSNYACGGNAPSTKSTLTTNNGKGPKTGDKYAADMATKPRRVDHGAKHKDLLMIPARVALALQADGWYLRSHCIWHKPNPMPESVRDRPTSAHESVFLLTKQPKYYYNADAVAETAVRAGCAPGGNRKVDASRNDASRDMSIPVADKRNMRNVWVITPKPLKSAHFATFPPELAARCIKAGSRPCDTILDPFFGAGTTALAMPDRDCIGIDINADYADLASARLTAAGLTVHIDRPSEPATALEAAE